MVKLSGPQLNKFSGTLCSQTVGLSGSSANHSPHLASFDTTVGGSDLGWTSPIFEVLGSGCSCVNKQYVFFDVGPSQNGDLIIPDGSSRVASVPCIHAGSSLSLSLL